MRLQWYATVLQLLFKCLLSTLDLEYLSFSKLTEKRISHYKNIECTFALQVVQSRETRL
jgi:hypothetical protein